MKNYSLRKWGLLVAGAIIGSLVTLSAPQAQTESINGKASIRKALSQKEEQFAACAMRCNFGKQAEKPLACLISCQKESKLSDKEVAAFLRAAPLGGAGFTCDPFESKCSCSGFFDCKVLERSGCCDGPINECVSHPGRPEVCKCEKSPQCSM